MFYPARSGLKAMQFLWDHYQGSYSFSPTAREEWLDEFFFCLLGGYSVTFELNKSTFQILKEKGYFSPNNDWEDEVETSRIIASELCKKQFSPNLKNGKCRAYRFPYSKSSILAKAGNWLRMSCNFHLEELFINESRSRENRLSLLMCPGFGYKSASWFLRNIGMGNDLAILDVHVYRTLKDFRLIPEQLIIPNNYMEIEENYCQACNLIGAKTETMDLIIWTWARQGVYETYGNAL